MGGRIAPGSLLIHDLEWAHVVSRRSPARDRRAGVPAARRRRRAPRLPGVRRRLREAVGGDHHEPGVQQVGIGIRRRPDVRRHRLHRPPRKARPVPQGVLQRASRPHAGGVNASKRARTTGARPAQIPMLFLLKSS